MTSRLHAGTAVTLWLAVLGLGLILLGAGIGLLAVAQFVPALIAIVVALIWSTAAGRQLSQSRLGLTLSIVEQQSPGQMLVTTQPGQGLPNAVLFSGHMGLLILIRALQDSTSRISAVPPPGADFRTIAGLLRTSHATTRVIAATAENAQLCAQLDNGQVVVGSSTLERGLDAPIDQIYLSSDGSTPGPSASWPVSPELEEAMASADLILFGPGSFYTSVVPSLLVPGIRERVAASRAVSVFVCSLMTEPGRTDGWSVSDFVRNFTEFAGFAPQYTIVNRSYPGSSILGRYEVTGSYPVMVTPEEHIDSSKVMLGGRFPGSTTLNIGGSTILEADIIEVKTEERVTFDPHGGTADRQTVSVIRHDAEKLARVLRNIITQSRSRALTG